MHSLNGSIAHSFQGFLVRITQPAAAGEREKRSAPIMAALPPSINVLSPPPLKIDRTAILSLYIPPQTSWLAAAAAAAQLTVSGQDDLFGQLVSFWFGVCPVIFLYCLVQLCAEHFVCFLQVSSVSFCTFLDPVTYLSTAFGSEFRGLDCKRLRCSSLLFLSNFPET
jgi:hypothetical protein